MRRNVAVIGVMALLLVACGGGSDTATDTSEAVSETTQVLYAETTVVEVTTTTEAPFDISMIEPSIVKILSEGSFTDYESLEAYSFAGIGSGAVISTNGLVVTNNHVVTGAALIEVQIPGQDRLVNARILGASECYDLAVIDLEGDGYQALEFHEEEPKTGLQVYAAGYPAVDEYDFEEADYTLTQGIVASTNASGESSWASLPGSVLEHTAQILAGNSGGPLVDEDGRIVALNYAGNEDIDKNYAIPGSDVQAIVERLAAGENVESLGINGEAIWDEYAGITGIWVSNVKPGSLADKAGVEGGDLITSLQGLPMGLDGTMADYCDVLRTNGTDSVMSIEVLRWATSEMLAGQINGDPLELTFSFAQEFEDSIDYTGSSSYDYYSDYGYIEDDSGAVSVLVPVEWIDVDGTYNDYYGGPSLWASPSIDDFMTSFSTPGVQIDVSMDGYFTIYDLALEDYDMWSSSCSDGGTEDYDDGVYFGVIQIWQDCGSEQALVLVLGAEPWAGEYYTIRVLAQVVSDADLEALDNILNSFFVLMG